MKSARGLFAGAVALLLAVSATVVTAQQAWPNKPVKFIVPSAGGSSPDRVTRMLALRLSKKWAQPVIVENKAGATSMIGSDFVAKSPADGYTMLSTFTSFVQVPALFRKIPYDTERDFVPVTQTIEAEVVFLVGSDSPYRTLSDFVVAARTAKPPLSYASFGTGSSFHIYGEMLAKAMHMDLVHVPYKGEVAATTDLLGGQVTSSFASVGTALPFIKSGKLRALGVVFPQRRSKVLPDVSTFAEAGAPSPDVGGWFGVLAPAGTPSTVIQKVSADIREILEQPDVIASLREQGLVPIASKPEAFGARIHEDLRQWKTLLLEFGIQPGD
jgi:tripartite-type tricarboxylate transporter receptor subunit TctC